MQLTRSNFPTMNGSAQKLKMLWAGLITFLSYVKSFKWVVDVARWIQDTGAVIAESAFTLAILYVIIHTFGYSLISWIPDIDAKVNPLIMIVFTILPELVMIPIILTTSDHFQMARRTGDKKNYAWFAGYALLTILFIALTLILLSGLAKGIQPPTPHAAFTQSDGQIFILRCFSGLLYTVLQRLWDAKGKKSYTAHYDKLMSEVTEGRVLLSEKTVLLSEKTVLLSELQEKLVTLEQEKMSLSLALAGKKVTRKSHTLASTKSNTSTIESNTPTNITDIRSKLKHEITQVVTRGKKVNYTEIGKSVGVHPNTVRKHAPSILTEISQELPAVNS